MGWTRRPQALATGLLVAGVLVLCACSGETTTSDSPPPPAGSRSSPTAPAAEPLPSPTASVEAPGQVRVRSARVKVLSANVRAGSRYQRPLDIKGDDDRRAFARRVLDPGRGGAPDVMLLQETIGTTRSTVRALNDRARARNLRARYVVALAPDLHRGAGRCDGRRAPHYRMRDTAIIVNVRTVGPVLGRGSIRTWGNWDRAPGLQSVGCSEQGWVHVRLSGGDDRAAELFVVNVHLAPADPQVKTEALDVALRAALRRHASAAPKSMLVMAGDFNLARCPRPGEPERADCRPRPLHRLMEGAGFTDVIRDQHLRGHLGVVGVRKRIDFIYAQDRVIRSRWDRCYLAYLVTVEPCGRRAVFSSEQELLECQRRADDFGVRGGSCPARQYRRYYSDHPILRATLAH